MTKEYLKQLNEYVKDNDAELIVMLIPSWADISQKDNHYLNAVKILNELSLEYFETVCFQNV